MRPRRMNARIAVAATVASHKLKPHNNSPVTTCLLRRSQAICAASSKMVIKAKGIAQFAG